MCKECNSTKVMCEYCPSMINFDRLRSHMKNFHEKIDLAGGIHPVKKNKRRISVLKIISNIL